MEKKEKKKKKAMTEMHASLVHTDERMKACVDEQYELAALLRTEVDGEIGNQPLVFASILASLGSTRQQNHGVAEWQNGRMAGRQNGRMKFEVVLIPGAGSGHRRRQNSGGWPKSGPHILPQGLANHDSFRAQVAGRGP